MKKSLEEFAKENRSQFDLKIIDENVWNRIAPELKKKKRKEGFLSSIYFKWVTAAAILIFAAGAFFFFSHRTTEKQFSSDSIVHEQYPEYDTKIKSFASLIEGKKAGLKMIEHEQPEIYAHFVLDGTELSRNYEELKDQLRVNPNRNFLLTEMIENLELQVRLLNQQLELIKQLKESNKRTDAKSLKNI